MSQLKKVVEPFGEVNVYPGAGGTVRVTATILMEPRREGTQTGIALDGSASMSALYGVEEGGGFLASLFGLKKKSVNQVTDVARKLCSYLARNLDADGGTTCIYWAVGPGGSQVEVVGDLTADEADGHIFITDGELHDLEDVKAYSRHLAHEVAAGRRPPLKFVLIGVGPSINERQMEELDDLDTGTEVDLWDHKISAEMRQLQDIFAEVIDENVRVADAGRILDEQGKTVRDFSDTGLPGKLEFDMPAGAAYFTLDVNGHRIHQGLSDTATVPPPEKPA